MVGKPGMEAVESGMVRSGTEERQADEPAHEEIACEVPFELSVRTGVSPGADEFGEDKGSNGKGGRSAGSGGMVIVATCADNIGGVIEVGEADEGMAGTVEEHGLIDESADPGQDEGEELAKHSLHDWRKVRKVGGRSRRWEW
jgi:hypothetical protein